ncbi:hypothetical protein J3F83DRAFT_738225 [Trichoderma novae-zelandiae]
MAEGCFSSSFFFLFCITWLSWFVSRLHCLRFSFSPFVPHRLAPCDVGVVVVAAVVAFLKAQGRPTVVCWTRDVGNPVSLHAVARYLTPSGKQR